MNLYVALFSFLIAVVISYIAQDAFRGRERASLRCAAILVLGDIGRSPRMMYHAQSFAREGFQTFIIGYYESQLPNTLRQLPMAIKIPLTAFPGLPRFIPFIALAPFKALWQMFSLFNSLTARLPYIPEFILVQVHMSLSVLCVNKLVFVSERTHPASPLCSW